MEAHSWRDEELGVKDNKVLGFTQAEESVSPPWEVAESSGLHDTRIRRDLTRL